MTAARYHGGAGRRLLDPLSTADVLQLPWAVDVELLRKQFSSTLQRRPISELTGQLAEVRSGNRQTFLVIELIGLDEPTARMLDRPHRRGQRASDDLHRRRIRKLDVTARLFNRQL